MQRFLSAVVVCVLLMASLPSSAVSFSNIVVFGDSLSDTGNFFAATGNMVPNASYYDNGRFQNGPSYIESLAGSLGLAADHALFGGTGTNFAVGGARSRYHVLDVDANGGIPPVGLVTPTPYSLRWQFDQFYAGLGDAALDPDALYVVWEGANDIQDVLTLASLGNLESANVRLSEAVSDVATEIARLVNAGAETLLVPLLPDLGLTPAVRSAGPSAQAAARLFSNAFNNALDAAIGGLTADIVRFDTFAFLDEVVKHSAAFGFANTTDPCLTGFYVYQPIGGPITMCGTPDAFLFWDIVHPSARLHEILGTAMRYAVPEPATLALLCLGIAGIGLQCRNQIKTVVRLAV